MIVIVARLVFQHLLFYRIMSEKFRFVYLEDTHRDLLLDESADHNEVIDTGDHGDNTTEDQGRITRGVRGAVALLIMSRLC